MDESAHVATSKPRPDQEGIPLNAASCQRPWVVAAQPHERPLDMGFDGSITRHLMINFFLALASRLVRKFKKPNPAVVGRPWRATRSRDTILAREPRVAGVGTTPESRCVGQEGTSPYCQRPRRQHGQHHASNHSDRRDHRSRRRLVRPGTLVLALPFLGQRG